MIWAKHNFIDDMSDLDALADLVGLTEDMEPEPTLERKPMTPGRRRNLARIHRIRELASMGKNDSQIARIIGSTHKAVSNYRYRYGIPSGYRKNVI